jgi:hypothetical protein
MWVMAAIIKLIKISKWRLVSPTYYICSKQCKIGLENSSSLKKFADKN